MIVVVLGLFAAHAVEAWIRALFYWASGEIVPLSEAVYFSTVTYTTLGYGDITLSPDWHVTSSLQAVSGIILFGWSTAFLVHVRTFFWRKYGISHTREYLDQIKKTAPGNSSGAVFTFQGGRPVHFSPYAPRFADTEC